MKEQFLPYNLSLKLKEIGFNDECIAVIDNYDALYIKGKRRLPSAAVVTYEVPSPLYQQAFLFLSKLQSNFKISLDENGWFIYNLENEVFYGEYALIKLIECVENKK